MSDATKIVIGMSTWDPRNVNYTTQTRETAFQAFNGTEFFLYKLAQVYNSTYQIASTPISNSSTTFSIKVPVFTEDPDDGPYRNFTIEIKRFISANSTVDHVAMCNDPDISMVIGPLAPSPDCVNGALITNQCGKIYITPCSLQYDLFSTVYQYVFQVPTFAELVLKDKMPYFRLNNIKRVAFLWGKNNYYSTTICTRGISDFSTENEVEVAYQGPMIHDFVSANVTDVLMHLDNALASGAEGLVFCGFPSAAVPIAKQLKALKRSFDLTLLAPDRNYPLYLSPDELEYFTVSTKTHPGIQYVDRFYTDKTTAFAKFYSEFRSIFGVDPDSGTGLYFYSLYMLIYALETLQPAGSVCTRENNTLFTTYDIRYTLGRAIVPTLYSTMQFDPDHRSLSTEALIQFRNKTSFVVAPVSASNAKFVAPAPTWTERVYSDALSSAEIGFIALAIVFIAFSLVLMVVVLILRRTSLISVSMPQFLLLILLGSILIDIGVILWRYHGLTGAGCHLRVWCIAIGFVLMFGCLIAKSFRVWYLWSSGFKTNKVVTNTQLSLFIGVSVLATSILLAIYSGIGDVKVVFDDVQEFRPGNSVQACSENTSGTVVIYIMIAAALAIMVIGLVFAFLTRKIPFLAFNESKIILFSMYNVIFFAVLTIIVVSVDIPTTVKYILRSLCILLSSFLTILIMMGTKLWYLSHDKNARSKKTSGHSGSHGSTTGTGTNTKTQTNNNNDN